MLRLNKNFIRVFLTNLILIGGFYVSIAGAEEQSGFVYLFKLYYDKGQLFADRDFEFKYDLIAENYTPETLKGQDYLGEVIAIGGKKEATFQFSARQGKMTAKAPYFSDADIVNFYNPEGQKLLTISVRESSVCDNNGVCEEEVGENKNNCLADCNLRSTPSLSITPASDHIWRCISSGGSGGILKRCGNSDFFGIKIYYLGMAIIVLIVILAVFFLFRFWKNKKNIHDLPPPQIQ